MHIRARSTALLLFAFSISPAFAQVTISPASPKAQEPVHVLVPPGTIVSQAARFMFNGSIINDYNPLATLVSMAGNKITISVQLSDNEFGSPAGSMDMPVGQFPAGSYQVEVVRRLPDDTPAGTVGATEFSVSARAANEPLWNNTDLWWDPDEPGWGLNLVQHGPGVLVGTWHVYSLDGKPIWYVMPGGTWISPTRYRGPIYRTVGPSFGAVPFNANEFVATLVGESLITFDAFNSNSATALLTVEGVTVVRPIRRQPF